MEKSFPFNATLVDGQPDRAYSAEDFAAERAAYVSNGVTSKDSLTVTAGKAGGMTVDVSAGMAVIDGYTYRNTDSLTLSVSAADKNYPRVDLAVLRLDLDAVTTVGNFLCLIDDLCQRVQYRTNIVVTAKQNDQKNCQQGKARHNTDYSDLPVYKAGRGDESHYTDHFTIAVDHRAGNRQNPLAGLRVLALVHIHIAGGNGVGNI